MQPQGSQSQSGRGMPGNSPLNNVATFTNNAAANTVPLLQIISNQQRQQTQVLVALLNVANQIAKPANMPGGEAKSSDSPDQKDDAEKQSKTADKIQEAMGQIKGLLVKAAYAGTPGGSSTIDKTQALLLASFGMFLTPAIMLASAGMLTLADLINSKLIPNTKEVVKAFADVVVWAADAGKGVGNMGSYMTQDERKEQAERRKRADAGMTLQEKGERKFTNRLIPGGDVGRAALDKIYDRAGRDTPEEAKNEEFRRRNNRGPQPMQERTPEQNAAIEAWKRGGMQGPHPLENVPKTVKPGEKPPAVPNIVDPMAGFVKNMRAVIADMRTNIAKPPEFSSIEGLWAKMQMRVYTSPIDQMTREYQLRSIQIMEDVVSAIENNKQSKT